MGEKNEFEILASAARTATNTKIFELSKGVGMILYVDVTARGTACTLTPQISGVLPNGAEVSLWTATAAINSADTTVGYSFYPGAGSDAAADYIEEVSMVLPATLRLTMTHSDSTSITYSVYGVELA